MPEFENDNQGRAIAALVDHIDSHVFTGDGFHNPKNRVAFREYLARWARELDAIERDQ